MKSLLLIVTASLMLVGATVAVGIPNVVQANPPIKWCFDDFRNSPHCFTTKGYCKKAFAEEVVHPGTECHKVIKEL